MNVVLTSVCLSVLVFTCKTCGKESSTIEERIRLLDPTCKERLRTADEQMRSLMTTVDLVTRQVMMQQFYSEEKTRSDGDSGIKQLRTRGFNSYHANSYTGRRAGILHDHPDETHTLGMAQFVGVVNGVQFQTSHNEYKLHQKSRTSTEYKKTEPIEFPIVPPEVQQQKTVDGQIQEMREWFRAFANQNTSVRDYRLYFKPVLCYLEGMWTNADPDQPVNDPSHSDRHFLDAETFNDLFQEGRFTSYTGTEDAEGDLAYLPRKIISIDKDSKPVFAQWDYHILCHPLSIDVPLSALKPVDDIRTRKEHHMTYEQYVQSNMARFKVVGPNDQTKDPSEVDDTTNHQSMLDELMAEVPGQDNYPGYIEEKIENYTVYPYHVDQDTSPLNTAYYHRSYSLKQPVDKGFKRQQRGFADRNLFMAQTSTPKIVGLPKPCRSKLNCTGQYQRFTYGIPLEIIYLTPLSRWNPFDIAYKGDADSPLGRTVTDGPTRTSTGQEHPDLAFNGTNDRTFYRTPAGFFEDTQDESDTTKDAVQVLDRDGASHHLRGSGLRVMLPPIEGVGSLRTRYPIFPLHQEGSAIWKELEALEDVVLYPNKYKFLYN